jgi:hypothetical protein
MLLVKLLSGGNVASVQRIKDLHSSIRRTSFSSGRRGLRSLLCELLTQYFPP